MSVDDRHIVGSAEPLTPDQRIERMRELQAWGVDLSLLRANMELTPTQRLEAARHLLGLSEEMQRAWHKKQLEARGAGAKQENPDGITAP